MYGYRTHHQVAGHIRLLITSNSATRRTGEQTNPLGESKSDCELDRGCADKCYRLPVSIGGPRPIRRTPGMPGSAKTPTADLNVCTPHAGQLVARSKQESRNLRPDRTNPLT